MEMREESIKMLVVTLKGLSHTLDLVIQTVAEKFGLSLEEAEEKTKRIGGSNLPRNMLKKDCNSLLRRI